MLEKITACACQSGKAYAECCQPFHLKIKYPETAEQLMRSRYSAYTLVNIPYIVETTVPNQQKYLDQIAMREWGETTLWAGLEIVKHLSYISKNHSKVEFNAFFKTEEGIQVHNEISLFVKINQKWFFVDPTVPLPNQKQNCLCASGKKFKYCCGKYL